VISKSRHVKRASFVPTVRQTPIGRLRYRCQPLSFDKRRMGTGVSMAENHNYLGARRHGEMAKCKQTITRLFVVLELI
ncbi:unnamed protein product, partial [Heterotrigona itama]